jgi:PIN like domain
MPHRALTPLAGAEAELELPEADSAPAAMVSSAKLLAMLSGDRDDDENNEDTSESLSGLGSPSDLASRKLSGIFDNGFEAYRTVTDDDYRQLFTSGLIILDTNVLLDLYRYHPETRKELLDVLDQLRERLWIPNQVMSEFWAGRESVLEDASDISSTVGILDKLGGQYMDRVREWTNSAGLRGVTADSLVEISKAAFDATIDKIRSLADDKALKAAENTAEDPVIVRLDSIFQGRVGNPLSVERRRIAINEEAPQRFADNRPPGYMDANKKNGNPVGDYLIWIEILEEAEQQKVDVLLVTRDTKEDWYRQERGQTKGPNPQLVEEMRNVAGVRLFMLRPASFLKHAGDLLQVKVSPESVEDAQRVTVKTDVIWRVRELEHEIANKLRLAFGESSVSAPDFMGVHSGRRMEADAIVRLPGKVPVVFEMKFVSSPRSLGSRTSDALRQTEDLARRINGRGVLVLITSDEFSSEDIERWTRQVETRLRDYPEISSYIARDSDFLNASPQAFADRVIPSDPPSL